jgi:hypothetical protein
MTDDISMWDDPQESSALRQLLRAGQVENSDYDVDRGLARHLAQLQAGTPLPAWAVQTTLQKSASWSVLAWLLPPVISAGVVGAWLAIQPAEPAPVSLVPVAPPPAAAPAHDSALSAARAVPVVAQEPASNVVLPSSAAESGSHDVRDSELDRHDAHAALARATRQPARTLSTRRGRSQRADDASYAAVQATREGNGAGFTSAGAGLTPTNTVDTASKAAPENSAANKPAAKVEPTAAAQEVAPAEEAKAKSERRTKEEEGAAKVDEVSGARLEREMRMLAVAQRVLSEDPARSLRLCRQGESEFRGSMFSAERKQVALLALVQLGKVDQARREGIPFLRAFPNAPWSARLREALSTGRVPNP